MLNRFATLAAICLLVPVGTAPLALADPPPPPVPAPDAGSPPDAGPPPDTGVVASEVPGIAHTQDGRTLTVSAKDETQLPVAPLTTALSSRDWLVGGTFTGNVTGSVNGGSLEAGYQIGCAVAMDKIKLNGSIGVSTGNLLSGTFAAPALATSLGLTFPIAGQIEVEPRPGEVINVPVDKKTFKGTNSRVTLRDVHIKIDNCVGASSLRSYAVLTSSGTDTDDIVAYYGVTKTF
jgi:hypothetical protein